MATMNTVIEYVDRMKPNAYSDEDKYRWINTLEGMISREVLHEDAPEYSLPEDADMPLLVSSPYDEIYHLYVSAMIDFHNREYEHYNNTAMAYTTMLEEFKKWYLRKNRPESAGNFYNY